MKVHIPNSAFIGNIESFIDRFDPNDTSLLEVTANQKWISVHPVVIAMIIALSKQVRHNGGEIKSTSFSAKSRPYLVRMGLIPHLDERHGINITEHEASGRFIPATQIQNSKELNQFLTDMIPLLHTDLEQAYPIKYVMSELIRNVIEHSASSMGAIVCAQYYKKSNRISIGVSDVGIGIKQAINQSYETATDEEAIKLALRPGITGTTRRLGGSEFNAGAGLFFTKSIAKVSRGFFIIYSGNTYYKLLKTKKGDNVRLYADPNSDRHTLNSSAPIWNGTAVGIDISLDMNQEFEELLEKIRDAYHHDVKRAKKEKYKKPRFI